MKNPFTAPFYLLYYLFNSLLYKYHYKKHKVEVIHADTPYLHPCYIEYRKNKITGKIAYRPVSANLKWRKTKEELPEIIKESKL